MGEKIKKSKRKYIVIGIVITLLIAFGANYYIEASKAEKHYYILNVDDTRAYTDERNLVNLGPRLSGTKSEWQGAQYIETQFKGVGLSNVHIEWYNVTCYKVEYAEMSMKPYLRGMIPDPRMSETKFTHLTDFTVQAYSGSRIWQSFRDDLEVVDIGNASSPDAFSGINGRAVIATNDNCPYSYTQLRIKVWENGGDALIIHNVKLLKNMDYPPISFSADVEGPDGHPIPLPDNYTEDNWPDIPTIMVSKKVGNKIKEMVQMQNARLRLNIQLKIEKKPICVVVGEKIGTENKNEIVMLGAHHDTVYTGPGAVDNTVGVVSVISIAREIVKLNTKKTLRFVTFGGEEEGLLGSYEYYKAHADELKGSLSIYLNLDMSHVDIERDNKLPIAVANEKHITTINSIWHDAKERIPDLKKYEVVVYQSNLTSSSDMATFSLEGFEVASCWGSGCWEYHTPKDDIHRINRESFKLVGAVYGSFALHLAGIAS